MHTLLSMKVIGNSEGVEGGAFSKATDVPYTEPVEMNINPSGKGD